jgi:hypothetical protein
VTIGALGVLVSPGSGVASQAQAVPRSRRDRLLDLLRCPALSSALAALAVTSALYAGAAGLPFFSDDLLQVPWIESLSWAEVWTAASPFGDHRPLWALSWKAYGALAGGLRPLDLHLVNVALHATAAWLVGLLGARWGGRGAAGKRGALLAALAAVLFASFPFSREAVVWVSAFSYPLSTLLCVATVVAYDRGRASGSRPWLLAALFLAGLAFLAYEAGLVACAFVLVAELVGRMGGRWRRSWLWPLLFSLLLVGQLIVWRVFWTPDAVVHTLSAGDIVENTSFVLQGLVHPVSVLAHLAAPTADVAVLLALFACASVALAIAGWRAAQCGERQALLLGLGWFVVASVPSLFARKGIADAPRFLYPAAVGVALVWSSSLAAWLSLPRRSAKVLAALAAVAVTVSSAAYVWAGMALYGACGQVLWEAIDAAGKDTASLFVNLPMRLTPTARTYSLGFEGAIPLTPEVTLEDLVYVHTGVRSGAEAAAFGIVLVDSPERYRCEVFGPEAGWVEMAASVRRAGAVYLTRYDSHGMRLVPVGGPAEAGQAGAPVAYFGEHLALCQVAAGCERSGRVAVSAVWRVDEELEADATVFAHLVDSEGRVASQADGYPLGGMLPFWLWKVDEVMRDERTFTPVGPGEYEVRLGVWEVATGELWPAAEWPGGSVSIPVACR